MERGSWHLLQFQTLVYTIAMVIKGLTFNFLACCINQLLQHLTHLTVQLSLSSTEFLTTANSGKAGIQTQAANPKSVL